MTRYLTVIAAITVLFALDSCDEVGPPIDFSKVTNRDTSYVDAVPTAQDRRVLVEEFTGVQCTNCPAGTAVLTTAEEASPGRVIVVSLHGGAQTEPLPESKYSFSNNDALTLVNSYFNENPPKPAACIDRTKNGAGEYFIFRQFWADEIANRLGTATPVNLDVSSTYNPTTSEAVIKVKVAYTGTVTKKQSLTIMIEESGIVDAQEFPDHIDEEYVHNHVFRGFVSAITGSSILDDVSEKTAGRVFERTIVYPVNASWKPENCKVVAFVHNNEDGDKEVMQAAEADLKD